MTGSTFTYVLLSVGALVLFFYFIAPRLRLISYRSDIIRAILFFGAVGYLAYDFYMKEKYSFLVILALAAAAFMYYLLGNKSK